MITIIHTYIDDDDDTNDAATVDNDAWGTNRIQMMMMMLMTMIIQIFSFYQDGDNGDSGADKMVQVIWNLNPWGLRTDVIFSGNQ